MLAIGLIMPLIARKFTAAMIADAKMRIVKMMIWSVYLSCATSDLVRPAALWIWSSPASMSTSRASQLRMNSEKPAPAAALSFFAGSSIALALAM
jgi:hypothetical protein